MITLEKFKGHIVLYCKGHYNQIEVDFIEGLRRIWGTRCGLAIEHVKPSFDRHIADELHEIIKETAPQKLTYLSELMHKDIADDWHYNDLTAIERIIMSYYKVIMQLQVREISGKKRITIIKLPKPQKRLFKRIVRGNFKSNDYDMVK